MPEPAHIGRGLRRRFDRCVRQAALHATADERVDLDGLVLCVRAGTLQLPVAQELVSALLADQEQRHIARRAAA